MEDFGFEEVRLSEFPLPGKGRFFGLTLSDGTVVQVISDSDSDQSRLAILPPDSDAAIVTLVLSRAEAITLSTLLAGIKYVVRSDEESRFEDGVTTVTLSAGSPAIGKAVGEIELPDTGAAQIIAALPHDSDRPVEIDSHRRCEAGDRLVLVGRPAALADLVRHLEG